VTVNLPSAGGVFGTMLQGTRGNGQYNGILYKPKNSVGGRAVGRCTLPDDGGWGAWEGVHAALAGAAGREAEGGWLTFLSAACMVTEWWALSARLARQTS
jgi:hypothetical protein